MYNFQKFWRGGKGEETGEEREREDRGEERWRERGEGREEKAQERRGESVAHTKDAGIQGAELGDRNVQNIMISLRFYARHYD